MRDRYPPLLSRFPSSLAIHKKRWGVPPPPSLFSHHAWRISGYKSWRSHRAPLLALSRFCVNFFLVGEKKNMSRRKSLGCLLSYVNAKGETALGRRVRPERTHVERVAMRMAERREETWRSMNRQRVAAFIRLYLLALVYDENAYRQPAEKKHQKKFSTKPWSSV